MECPTCCRGQLEDHEDPKDAGAALVKCSRRDCAAVFSVLLERVA